MKVWKIQRKDGTFSSGSTEVSWRKKGKIWSQISFVKAHLNQFTGQYSACHLPYSRDDVVIEYDLVEVRRMPVTDLIP
jgi:hypothetical protein